MRKVVSPFRLLTDSDIAIDVVAVHLETKRDEEWPRDSRREEGVTGNRRYAR